MLERTCRACGCTDTRACVTQDGPCCWVEWDLCSACDEGLPMAYPATPRLDRVVMVVVLISLAVAILAVVARQFVPSLGGFRG